MIDLAWMIPLAPLTAFVAIALGAHRSRRLSQYLTIAAILVALVVAQGVLWTMIRSPEMRWEVRAPWFSLGTEQMGLGVYIDPADAVMVAMVTVVCLLVFIYSVGYMRGEPRYARFFAYVSLFAAAMLSAMVCDNLLLFFISWEIMGVCSYLLIGFSWERSTAAAAGLKAFIVMKFADLFLLLGIALLYARVGSLAYADVFDPARLLTMAETPYLGQLSVATVAALLLFGGAMGKSAQFPLHVWLPDATEGPTPASAMIYAATTVAAGVYLLIRAFPLLAVSEALPVLGVVGTVTALVAAVIAVTQNDIKQVLAYATVSQLGYMIAALGVGGYAAGLFHLVIHAFFSSLLFMAAGSVIRGVEYGHHRGHGHAIRPTLESQAFSPEDMWQMGGLAFRMPFTAVTFLVGSLALSGFPLVTAGFWSKDGILATAWGVNRFVFWGLAIAAGLTAFSSARQLSLTFLGASRSRAAVYARENQLVMTGPLMILAVFAVSLGWLGIPDDFPMLGALVPNWFPHFVEESLHTYTGDLGELIPRRVEAWQPLVVGVLSAVGGLLAGLWLYRQDVVAVPATANGGTAVNGGALPIDPLSRAMASIRMGWLYDAVEARFYLDALYQRGVVRPSIWVSRLSYRLDRGVIDATVVSVATSASQSDLTPALDHVDRRWIDGFVRGLGYLAQQAAVFVAHLDHYVLDRIVWLAGVVSRGLSNLLDIVDDTFVDGLVRGAAALVHRVGRWVRRMETGMLPNYLWNALVMVLLLVAVLILFQHI